MRLSEMSMALVLAAATFQGLPAGAQNQEPVRKLHHVAGDVYLFQNNFHLSLVVPTEEGTVRVDPINADAGAWLNENLGEIGGMPVSHLIYSHSHADHASGGGEHGEAVVYAHEAAPEQIDGVTPDVRVSGSEVLEVGGKRFEMTDLGPGHGTDMLAVVVRPENVGFIVDVAAPKRLPYRDMGGANVDDWIAQIKAAQALDFEIFAPGHGNVGVKADLDDALEYMETLRKQVLAGLKDGRSVEELQQELTLEEYSGWLSYDEWRALNIAGMAAYLQGAGLVE